MRTGLAGPEIFSGFLAGADRCVILVLGHRALAWEITGAACVILNMVLLALQDRKKEK